MNLKNENHDARYNALILNADHDFSLNLQLDANCRNP